MEILATLSFAVVIALGASIGLLVLIAIARMFLVIGRPNEVLIFSGRGAPRVVFGRAFRIPLIERVDQMDLGALALDLQVSNAFSQGGIPLNVHAIANVKVSRDPKNMMNAVERFLGRDSREIRRVAKESLEGHLRGVLAKLTPEEINEDRLKFANALIEEAEADLQKLGLELDTLRVLNVSDDVNYLDSISRQQIANVLMVADIAESDARSKSEQAAAESNREGQVAFEQAEARIAQKQNELRKVKADCEARAKAEEERTEQLAAEARAAAEQELQQLRSKLEETRLTADLILPAQAEQRASALRARGEASTIAENGRAVADVLRMLTETWTKAGPAARDVFLMQQIEPALRTIVGRLEQLEVGEVNLVDQGDGKALAAYVSGYPAMVGQILEELKHSTGVDIPSVLSRSPRASESA